MLSVAVASSTGQRRRMASSMVESSGDRAPRRRPGTAGRQRRERPHAERHAQRDVRRVPADHREDHERRRQDLACRQVDDVRAARPGRADSVSETATI